MRKSRTLTLRGVWMPVGALLVALLMTGPARGGHNDRPVVRGEMARLYRQAYDYNYRNSNRNVFRSSRHYHPTRNVFRSSRHYQGRLAASFAGYPLRTTFRYSEDDGSGSPARGRSVSVVHPRRHPTGPVGFGDPGYVFNRRAYPHDLYQNPSLESLVGGSSCSDPRANKVVTYTKSDRIGPQRPESREISMVQISTPRAEATQRVVQRTITQPDGSIRTVITSEPISRGLDQAWDLLERGDAEAAGDMFLRNSLDEKRGARR